MDAFYFAGFGTTTKNEKEMTDEAIIPQLWSRFYSEQISEQITNKKENTVLAVYTDYKTDVNGQYLFLIGHQLESNVSQEERIVVKKIPASTYLVFTSQRGPISEIVPKLWQDIWAYFETSTEVRTYTGDFERYDERAANPNDAIVDIYVAIQDTTA